MCACACVCVSVCVCVFVCVHVLQEWEKGGQARLVKHEL